METIGSYPPLNERRASTLPVNQEDRNTYCPGPHWKPEVDSKKNMFGRYILTLFLDVKAGGNGYTVPLTPAFTFDKNQ